MRASRVLPALLLLAAFSLAFQGSRGLWEPDEGRYTNIATEMLRSGNFLVPALNDEHPHFTKPPLTYWAIAGGLSLLGWNEWGARLPNAVAYVLTVLAVYALARRLMPERAWLAAGVYASLFLPYMAANVVTTDTLLSLWEAVAMLGFATWWTRRESHRGRWPRLGMWAAFGLAFFTKGPPGLLPLLAIAAFVALAGEWRRLAQVFFLPGLLVFAAVGLSWYGVVIAQRPELFEYFVRHEVVERIATGERRRNPQWYGWLAVYLPTLLVGALPWSVLVLGRLRNAGRLLGRRWWRERLASEPHAVLLALWLVAPLAVFCVARSRLPLYVLPLFVPLALLVSRQLEPRWPPARRTAALAALWFAALVAGRWIGASVHSEMDARPLARAAQAAQPDGVQEVVFVDDHPFWALSLYLRAEVEMVTLGPEVGWWANSTLDAEIDEHEPGSLFVVPRRKFAAFESILAARGLRADPLGSHAPYVFTRLSGPGIPPWPTAPARDRG